MKTSTTEKLIKQFSDFIEHERALSINTLQGYLIDLRQFNEFCVGRGLKLQRAKVAAVRDFMAWLRDNGRCQRSIARKVAALKTFYLFLEREEIIEHSPISSLVVSAPRPNIVEACTQDEVARVCAAPAGNGDFAMRDRAFLELLYASGGRLSEIINIKAQNIDWLAGSIKIMGKGSRERFVFMGKAAEACVKYSVVRDKWLYNSKIVTDHFFLNCNSVAMSKQGAYMNFKKYVKRAKLSRDVHPHMFRHAFATDLLKAGANLSDVQGLLGHKSIQSTATYIHLSHADLQAAHQKYHPMG